MMKVMLGAGAMRPIQWKPADLNFTADAPSASSSGSVGTSSPSTVPSFGATLKIWLAAIRLPAPGMLRGTTLGLPGMCLPMWRATMRA